VIDANIILPLILAVVIGIIEFISRRLDLKYKEYYKKIVSFTAGVSITYLLLELLPFFTENALAINKFLFISVLIGFVIHHVIEKEIYQHNSRHELIKKLTIEEHVFYFFYHLILGIVLVKIISDNLAEGLFYFVSILAYTLASNLPTKPHHSKKRMALLSTSTLIGSIIGISTLKFLPPWIEFSLIGFVAGVLLFTVTRHHIPHGRFGSVSYFTMGFMLYAFLIIGKWFL
jgi:hypothetical protein